MSMKSRAALTLCFLMIAVALFSCSRPDAVTRPDELPEAEAAPAEPEAQPEAAPETDEIALGRELIDAGAEPRELLSYDLEPHVSRFWYRMRVELTVDDESPDVPEMGFLYLWSVTPCETSEGHARVEVEIEDVEIDTSALAETMTPEMLEFMEEQFREMVGPVGVIELDEERNVVSVEMTAQARRDSLIDVAEMINQLAHQVPTPPLEPVGVGARWSMTLETVQQSMPVVMKVDETLVEREGSRVRIDQEYSLVGTADGAVVSGAALLEDYQMNGSGQISMDMKTLSLTSESHMRMENRMRMRPASGVGGQPEPGDFVDVIMLLEIVMIPVE